MYEPVPFNNFLPPSPTLADLSRTLTALSLYLDGELKGIAQASQDKVDFVQFNVLHVAPAKPREGMVVCADGTDWAPGVGGGLYQRIGGAWVKL